MNESIVQSNMDHATRHDTETTMKVASEKIWTGICGPRESPLSICTSFGCSSLV